MELTPLKSFLEVAREGHVTRAAARLHLTQPAVSAQLAKLEDELGVALFHRTPKRMVLTEAGRLFLAHVEQALRTLSDGQRALAELSGMARGTLSIGGGATATTYLLPPLLGRFHEAYPGIQLFVREQGSQGVVEAVLAGDLDLGVVTLPLDPTRGRPRLHVEVWTEDELRLIVPPGHALAGQDRFRWASLQGAPVVLFEAGTSVRDLIDGRLAAAGIEVQIVMELRSIESIKQMVAQGIGAGFVSRYALPDPRAGLACADRPLTRELALIHRADLALSAAARAFLDLMREVGPAAESS